MRMSRTLMVVAGLVLSLSIAASAQLAALKNTTPQQRATLLTRLMEKRLKLTGNTLQQVSAINLEYANKMQPILQGADRPLEEMREARQINEQKDAALQKVLSPEQFQQYQAAKEQLRQQFEQRIAQHAKAPAGAAQ
jgi:Spy/CpxP family protein refolding chaperone